MSRDLSYNTSKPGRAFYGLIKTRINSFYYLQRRTYRSKCLVKQYKYENNVVCMPRRDILNNAAIKKLIRAFSCTCSMLLRNTTVSNQNNRYRCCWSGKFTWNLHCSVTRESSSILDFHLFADDSNLFFSNKNLYKL